MFPQTLNLPPRSNHSLPRLPFLSYRQNSHDTFPPTHLLNPVKLYSHQALTPSDPPMARRRNVPPPPSPRRTPATMETEAEPLIPGAVPSASPEPSQSTTIGKVPWIPLAAASGACAAFNGVFAKLYVWKRKDGFGKECGMLANDRRTTTELTSSWAAGISTAVGLSATNKVVEMVIRAVCFPPF